MPRDPERIDRVLTLIRTAWEQMPDLRLGQLLHNVTGTHDDLFNYEDDQLLDDLEEWIDTSKNWRPR